MSFYNILKHFISRYCTYCHIYIFLSIAAWLWKSGAMHERITTVLWQLQSTLARGEPLGVVEGQLETSARAGHLLHWFSTLFRNVWFFSSAASPNHQSVREQCSADPRWHSGGIVWPPGWCVSLAALASSFVKLHSVHRAGEGFLCAVI